MFKRMALMLTFVATLVTASLTLSTPAQAWRYYGGPGPYVSRSYYGPPRRAYYAPYRSYSYYRYPGPYVVAPRPYYDNYYYGGPSVYYGSPGISVSYGF